MAVLQHIIAGQNDDSMARLEFCRLTPGLSAQASRLLLLALRRMTLLSLEKRHISSGEGAVAHEQVG
jgi:hypothetical protein